MNTSFPPQNQKRTIPPCSHVAGHPESSSRCSISIKQFIIVIVIIMSVSYLALPALLPWLIRHASVAGLRRRMMLWWGWRRRVQWLMLTRKAKAGIRISTQRVVNGKGRRRLWVLMPAR